MSAIIGDDSRAARASFFYNEEGTQPVTVPESFHFTPTTDALGLTPQSSQHGPSSYRPAAHLRKLRSAA